MTDLTQLERLNIYGNILLLFSLLLLLGLLLKLSRKNRILQKQLDKQEQLGIELKRNSNYLRKLIDSTEIGFGIALDYTIIEVNRQICSISGYSEDELIGKDIRFLYKNDLDYTAYKQQLSQQLTESGQATIKVEMVHKSGRMFNAIINSIPTDPNNLNAGLAYTVTDITKIKNTQDRLNLSENRFQLMMEAIPDPTYIGDQDNLRIIYINPAMHQRIGYDATGEHCYKALHNLNQPCDWCLTNRLPKPQNNYYEEEILSPLDNRFYLTTYSRFTDQNDKKCILTIFKDITGFKEIEKQLFQSQKMEAIGKLAGGVAHDFNNILTVIRGHAQLGMMDIDKSNPLWHDFNEIELAGDRAARLTRQLLAFSRKQVIKPEIIKINDFITDFSKMLNRLIGEDITLKLNLADNIPPIKADNSQLEQLVINLVVNSSDAIHENNTVANPEISISTQEIIIKETSLKPDLKIIPGNYLLLKVRDNGCGMTQTVAEHIFEPFYTTKEIGKGTGLGLSTVYGIIKQNHGEIESNSKPGVGTTFKIYWPCSKTELPAKTIKNNLDRMLKGNEVILLAEDEESTRKFAHHLLIKAGYTVVVAKNGVDALTQAQAYTDTIDLLFTDIVMPKMGGKELSEKFALLYPKAKIIFTTGYLGDRTDQNNINLKNYSIINKPYNVGELLQKIRKSLNDKILEENSEFNRRKTDNQPR